MAGPVTFHIDGLSELDAALGEFSKATAKNILKRVGKAALVPMAELAQSLAPVLTGSLKDSITEGTKLTSRQARLAKQAEGPSFVTIYMGPNDPAAVPQEFGTFDQPAQPFMRPAFAQEAENTIKRVADGLKPEIDKAAARARAKALKASR
jgi:HK97 gp10 family phage protein